MKTAIIKTDKGYHPIIEDDGRFYNVIGQWPGTKTAEEAIEVISPSPTLEAAKRRITRAGLTWEPEAPERITAWAAAKLAGVQYATIIRWVGRGILIPATTYPEQVTFTRQAVLDCAEKMKDVKAGRPRKEGRK